MAQAFERGDVPQLQAQLHRLKASCGFVGAAALLARVRALSAWPDDAAALSDFEAEAQALLAVPPTG